MGYRSVRDELAFTLRLSLSRSPHIIKRRPGTDAARKLSMSLDMISERQAKDILKRWDLKKKPGRKDHTI